jgi:adenylate cyclase
MNEGSVERRLAAILAADVVGYSRLMSLDEEGTLAALRTIRRELIEPKIAQHRGRLVKTTGDGALVEFASAVDATRCAIEIQGAMAERGVTIPAERRVELRIGINVGDIVIEDGDIFGDGVNIAARIESIAQPGGVSISEDVWRQVQGKVVADFVDTGEQSLKNIPRPVQVYRLRLGETAGAPSLSMSTSPSAPPAETPSLAVLPFQNMSADPEQEHFCDGLVEDILTTLAKLSGLRVIARNSSFVFKGRAVDVREAAKQLGVRYVLEGSVRKSGSRIRITAQLIDAKDGTHVWAERYDRSIDDVFAIQDQITLVLATEMQVKLTDGEQVRLRYTSTSNVEAWTYWVQGLSFHRKAITKDNTIASQLAWEKALALDPASAALNAMLGFVHSVKARFGWGDDGRESEIEKSQHYAKRALELDPNNADGHLVLGILAAWNGRSDEAVAHVRNAVRMAPGGADTLNLASFLLAPLGYPDEALVLARKSIALNPNHPAVYLGIFNAFRLSGQLADAIEAFEGYNARSPGFGLADLVITYREDGQLDKAKDAANRLLAARPDFTITGWMKMQFGNDKARLDADAAALRAVGLPTS